MSTKLKMAVQGTPVAVRVARSINVTHHSSSTPPLGGVVEPPKTPLPSLSLTTVQPVPPRSPVLIRMASDGQSSAPARTTIPPNIKIASKSSIIAKPMTSSTNANIPIVHITSSERTLSETPDSTPEFSDNSSETSDDYRRYFGDQYGGSFHRQRSPYDGETDLHMLKAMTNRLNLTTQRPSYIEWRTQYVDRPPLIRALQTIGVQNKPWTTDRKYEINQALDWLRNELEDMRNQDQLLARQLVSLRHDLQDFKLEKFCDEHKMCIEDARDELEEEDELSELCDSPITFGSLSARAPLKSIGVTRMNLERRRFSIL
ncbi:uncharacterized protein LOC141909512 [Tubulanus polymorphus]|uniref:uncharacterized protein LOC141909512 n=1 Tax=Tubulanus polymorphus TaxID=672921 RepID=UPI003DA670CE